MIPVGGPLLPLINGALTTSERGHGALLGGGFLFPGFIQENKQLIQPNKLSNFKSSTRSTNAHNRSFVCDTRPQLHTSEVIIMSWFGVRSGQEEEKKKKKTAAHYSLAQHSQSVACPLAWKRVSPSICSNDDVKLQLVDRVCPGVDLGSPTDSCEIFSTCNRTDMREASPLRAWQAALG